MITKILSQSSFWMVNKAIARHLKCNDSALLLSELIDKYDFYKSKDELLNGFFYYTSEMIENSVNITYHQQKKCIKKLKDSGFIGIKLTGIPAKLHFKIIENKILSFLNTGIKENAKQEVKKVKTNNTISNNTMNKELIINIEKKELYSELEVLFFVFNESFKTNHTNIESCIKNYEHWRKTYEPGQIEQSIINASMDQFWKDKLTPVILFRQKNTNKEDVDYIGNLLNKKPKLNKSQEFLTPFAEALNDLR